jgi:hypothetical protein
VTGKFELKRISREGIPKSIEKAEHYRLLNDPQQAESICLDVLEIDADNQYALRTLLLAITDQFGSRRSAAARQTTHFLSRLEDDFERTYYTGLMCERRARALLSGGMSRSQAYAPFREAMEWYEKARDLAPAGNDDPILRWNSCARTIMHERLEARPDDGELPLE